MQHDVDPMHRASRQWPTLRTAGAQQTPIEVVDVDGGQLVHRQMPEQRLEMTLDDAPVLAQRRGRPAGRSVGQPAIEQIGNRARPQPRITGLLDELSQLA
jgi:hypothetical protein